MNNVQTRPAIPACPSGGWGANYPMGMSPLELATYDKDLYALYRTNGGMGSGMIDNFQYDPVVSAGFLASDYVLSNGLAWVNLLTPDSQDNLNPGDNQIVPVDTYTDYKQLPPIEKMMIGPGGKIYETSYTGDQLEMQAQIVTANKGNLPPFKPGAGPNLMGDNSAYWAQEESKLVGTGGPSTRDRSLIENPVTPVIVLPGSGPPPRPNLSVGVGNGSTGSGTAVSTGVATSPSTLPGSGGGGAPMGDTSADAGARTATDEPADQPAATPAKPECKINYIPALIGLLLGLVLGYLYAKKKQKNKTMFAGGGAVVFGLLGYLYAKHQCKPIAELTKLGVKSESGFCAACGMVA